MPNPDFKKAKNSAAVPSSTPQGAQPLGLQCIFYGVAAMTFISLCCLFGGAETDICKPAPPPSPSDHRKPPPVEALGAPYLIQRLCNSFAPHI